MIDTVSIHDDSFDTQIFTVNIYVSKYDLPQLFEAKKFEFQIKKLENNKKLKK